MGNAICERPLGTGKKAHWSEETILKARKELVGAASVARKKKKEKMKIVVIETAGKLP